MDLKIFFLPIKKLGVESFFKSSSSVYGDNKKLPLSEDLKELKPLSPYAESKLENENFIYENKSS